MYKKTLPSKPLRHKLFGSVQPGEKTKPTKKSEMPDLQNSNDDFLFDLDAVGITNVKHPIQINSQMKPLNQTSIATFSFSSSLKQDSKGTNMSRFTEELDHQAQSGTLTTDLSDLKDFAKKLTKRLKAEDLHMNITVPWFFERSAPDSNRSGLNHADLTIDIDYTLPNQFTIEVGLSATITTLCPCSKEISEYSAHNQRGVVTTSVQLNADFNEETIDWKKELLDAAESNASAIIHPVLKRPDEKMVTETAYENPRFVEDMVRLVAADLYEMDYVDQFKVKCQNEESIHLHDAIASVTYDKRGS
ncbi:GTP cyclohydrolase I [Pelagirhabdus alkalitolerans]|uniref:GTP cyclohydrolase FolE2 n=1 Tax=Pelagirhabdus alkalitolerans TaxID=1612202 RepID=A0A1G6H6C1_9BACI|nr:GTP cyclohydrolase FolE2 [Pelagirhabdus alkalitolerans]SDB89819.1 GTP cyclohydrolase I [Pelagirhabdus alkalitolerans]